MTIDSTTAPPRADGPGRNPSGTALWVRGLLRHRRGRLLGVAAGVALSVSLLAALGAFLSTSRTTMTQRAAAGVAVDWQVQVAAGADLARVHDAVLNQPGSTAAVDVGFATADALSATTAGSTQTTGAAQVVSLPDTYRATFPTALRTLAGADSGVLLAQQTAANLRAGVGDTVTVDLGGTSVPLTVDGVVDLPQADSFFQVVGAPSQSQPIAPPDNVLLVPPAVFDQSIAAPAAAAGRPPTAQVHVARSHDLPSDPAAAFTADGGAARNTEVVLAGTGRVGDNLGATLDAARKDALYAQVLFLFLGTPGAVLAGMLTAAVAGSGADRRRRDQALLRARGAEPGVLSRLTAAEALSASLLGAATGLLAAVALARLAFGITWAEVGVTAPWGAAAAAVGIGLAFAVMLVPARRAASTMSVTGARAEQSRDERAPLWQRLWLDVAALVAAGAVFWATSRNGYTLVLVPEGVPALSVSYWAFAGPALLWIGAGLLSWRLTELLLRRGTRVVAALVRPLTGPLAGTVAASLRRQRRTVARAVVMLALAVAFAASTATFNATYRQQAEVDALLTNGADIAVTQSPGATVGPTGADPLAAVPGVRGVEPLQHRYAYVGADLQDLYGVRPGTIAAATSLQDAYFRGGTATDLMRTLATNPDSVLVSEETVRDFQLAPGDQITLRLQDATKQYVDVPFRYAGIAREFPTAPSDSFLVANADYVAARTGSDAVGTFLVDTGGRDTAATARRVRQSVGTSATVTEIGASRAAIGSSLTAVDLSGLTRIELAFAAVLATAGGALLLALGLAERFRALAVLTALGARTRHLAAFVVAEASTVVLLGLVLGAVTSTALTTMLVKVLTGVFDPAPAHVPVPAGYLAAVVAVLVAGVAAVVTHVVRRGRASEVSTLRET